MVVVPVTVLLVTTPVDEPMVAIDVVELDHVPPPVASLRFVVLDVHMSEAPVIGLLATVTTFVAFVPHPVA
jgi:hypothetical protein